MVVEFKKAKKTSEFVGVIVDVNGSPIPTSILELYEAKENGKLVSIYQTDVDGRFCIKNLKKGRYKLQAGWSKYGFNCTDMIVEISGRTKRNLVVRLEIGT